MGKSPIFGKLSLKSEKLERVKLNLSKFICILTVLLRNGNSLTSVFLFDP